MSQFSWLSCCGGGGVGSPALVTSMTVVSSLAVYYIPTYYYYILITHNTVFYLAVARTNEPNAPQHSPSEPRACLAVHRQQFHRIWCEEDAMLIEVRVQILQCPSHGQYSHPPTVLCVSYQFSNLSIRVLRASPKQQPLIPLAVHANPYLLSVQRNCECVPVHLTLTNCPAGRRIQYLLHRCTGHNKTHLLSDDYCDCNTIAGGVSR